MRNILSLCMILLLFFSCASTKTELSKEELKKVTDLIANKSFEIKSSWAYPRVTNSLVSLQNAGLFVNGSSAGSIDISGHSNYFIMKNDSVNVSLPYYGERQMGGNYGSTDNGIVFKGIATKIKTTKREKGGYKIRFSINDKNFTSENYNLTVLIYPNLSTNITVYSSHRNSIQYRGKIKNKS